MSDTCIWDSLKVEEVDISLLAGHLQLSEERVRRAWQEEIPIDGVTGPLMRKLGQARSFGEVISLRNNTVRFDGVENCFIRRGACFFRKPVPPTA